MSEILNKLNSELLHFDTLNRIENIEKILSLIEEKYPEDLQEAVNTVKNTIQLEAEVALLKTNNGGIAAMATGTGKSKIPINYILKNFNQYSLEKGDILLIVPTEKLRDESWKKEFDKWGASAFYSKVERTCYASLKNYKNKQFKLVIGDEFHNITEDKEEFFNNNTIDRSFLLTATPPKSTEKINLISRLGFDIVYTVSIDQAVRLRLVSPYKVTIVECTLDSTTKNIKAGSKDKPFFQTEVSAYAYKDSLARKAMFGAKTPQGMAMSKMRILDRRKFLIDLPSKKESAKFILQNLIPKDQRTLIFCGGIEQAIELCPHRFFSKVSASKSDKQPKKDRAERIMKEYQGDDSFNKFMAKEISRMSCVESLNEGQNIPDLDYILVVQANSNDKDILQRIGRLIRYRIGHIGKVVLMLVKNTQDEIWVNKAIEDFDQTRIRKVHYSNLVSGSDVLFID